MSEILLIQQTVRGCGIRVSCGLAARLALSGVLIVALAACGGLLDVSDPTLIRDQDIANASGANARRLDASSYLNQNAATLATDVAKITDEWMYDAPSTVTNTGNGDYMLNRRNSEEYEADFGNFSDPHLGFWDQIYYQTSIAIPAVRAYSPDSLRGDFLAQLYAIRGYSVLQLAEDLCPGFPLNDVSADNRPLYSGPISTDSAFALANASLDSAIQYARDSARFITLARVAKGRLLLDVGQYAAAAAVVAPVQTAWVYQTESPRNPFFMNPSGCCRGRSFFAVGNRKGGNGLPFVSAHDPRVPTVFLGVRNSNSADSLYRTTYTNQGPFAMTLASGVEARLIEAEVALHAGDPSWLSILNTLRATAITPALPDLSEPATAAEKVDLLYSERAFWLYLTGRRLGDLRRLIRNYGRDPETVFPTGPSPVGTYGTATAIPFVLAAESLSNPSITTGCTAR